MSDEQTRDTYEIEIMAIFETLLKMENDGVITHEQFLHYAKISEEEYISLTLTLNDIRKGNAE